MSKRAKVGLGIILILIGVIIVIGAEASTTERGLTYLYRKVILPRDKS